MAGRIDDKIKYLEGLNDVDFVFLCADILSIHFEHRDVKVVDGCGDGKRDIHSFDQSGNKCITQCKFHYDFNKSCGSSETDELVIALHKFGCMVGGFFTSGRLSPQAKREYLDNYPNYNLMWLEGHEVVDIVLSNKLLREVWIEGEKLHLAAKAIRIPFVIRRQPLDDIITLTDDQIKYLYNTGYHEIAPVVLSTQQFFPYRDVGARNKKQFYGNLVTHTLLITGNNSYTGISALKSQFLQDILKMFDSLPTDELLSVRFGNPFFDQRIESFNDYSSPRFNLPVLPETFVIQNGKIITEYDWLIRLNESWLAPRYIKMSQLANYRFYNSLYDLVLDFEYKDSADFSIYPEVENQIEAEKIYWEKSLFMIADVKNIDLFTSKKRLAPHLIYPYGSTEQLLCWFHPRQMVRPMDLERFANELDDSGFFANKNKLAAIAGKNNVEIVPWEFAAKIAAINGNDPFPAKPNMTFNFVDIQQMFDKVRSPIIPSNRLLRFECVWNLCKKAAYDRKKGLTRLAKHLAFLDQHDGIELIIDNDTQSDVYLKCCYDVPCQLLLPTAEMVDLTSKNALDIFDEISRKLVDIYPESTKSTSEYWDKELFIYLK